ncbi:hypothetical protein [Streptomyces alboflavus]|uniref:hypothetical protein n=1 Tax=Streptomyces alboflavus TaxID=67267 RepID=UPI001F01C931|nr:hypothetical protein [Streptomyces alboflavus]
MVVFDRYQELPAVIVDFQGSVVHLARDTGMAWRTRALCVRPATTYEVRQLRAICELVARQRRDVARSLTFAPRQRTTATYEANKEET